MFAARLHGGEALVLDQFRAVRGDLVAVRLPVQSRGLKQDRDAAGLNDDVHLAAVERNHLSVAVLYICAGNERHVVSQRLAGPAQDVVLFGVA
jgi:hypothetical protein